MTMKFKGTETAVKGRFSALMLKAGKKGVYAPKMAHKIEMGLCRCVVPCVPGVVTREKLSAKTRLDKSMAHDVFNVDCTQAGCWILSENVPKLWQ